MRNIFSLTELIFISLSASSKTYFKSPTSQSDVPQASIGALVPFFIYYEKSIKDREVELGLREAEESIIVDNSDLEKYIGALSETAGCSKILVIGGSGLIGSFFVKEFLNPQNFECLKLYGQVDEAKVRPFIAYKNLRNVRRSDPKDCKLIWNETFKYSFTKNLLVYLQT